MQLSYVLALVATVAVSVANASNDIAQVGVPVSASASSTELGTPVHFTHSTTLSESAVVGMPINVGHERLHHNGFAVGVPVSDDHPRHHHGHHGRHNNKDSSASFDGSIASSSSTDSSSDSDDIVQQTPQELALARLARIYGIAGTHVLTDLPTPAPTTFVTPAPTAPTPAPTTFVTPAPTAPTPAPTTTTTLPAIDASPSTVAPDSSNNPYIKQVAFPIETATPAATLAVETREPVVELLRDSDAVGKALAMSASTEEGDDSSVAVPIALVGCVAAALAVAVAAFVAHKKRASHSVAAQKTTASPAVGEDVDYNNEMVTPV